MTTKPFDISKRLVWEAYKRVKANAGAAGVDTTADFIGQPFRQWRITWIVP